MADKGIVACFDILGYQNIIDSNQIEKVANLISTKISPLTTEAQNKLSNAFLDAIDKDGYKDIKNSKVMLEASFSIAQNIKYITISDTIISSMSFDKIDNYNVEVLVWIIFLGQMAMLQRMSFDAGLPMRGAIDFGEFYIHGNNFAGKPIIDSFRLAQNLYFSGCVLTNKAGELLLSKIPDWSKEGNVNMFKVFNFMLLPYLAPLKDNAHNRLLLLNWLSHSLVGELPSIPDDLRQYVNTAFHDHNKEIDDTVTPKIENTERILRWMKEKKWELNEHCLNKSLN